MLERMKERNTYIHRRSVVGVLKKEKTIIETNV